MSITARPFVIMGIFICEKCGKLDNTACNNNYWHAFSNKYRRLKGECLDIGYKKEFEYFEDHVCCSDCCNGIAYEDDSGVIELDDSDIKDKQHWSKIGKEKLLEREARKDGSMVNATEYFKSNS